jgi:hypothetical protein
METEEIKTDKKQNYKKYIDLVIKCDDCLGEYKYFNRSHHLASKKHQLACQIRQEYNK